MTTKGEEKRAKNGKRVKVTIIDGNEQVRRMQEAVARRAYAIFESRGSGSWHELEDCHQAESELVRPLCCGRMTSGDSLWIGTNARIFEQGRSKSGSHLARSQFAGSRGPTRPVLIES
jgi:hypothetical protein